MSGIVMLKLEECRCRDCLRFDKISDDCRNHSAIHSITNVFPGTYPAAWCCEGLWKDHNGRIWTWDQVCRDEHIQGAF